MSHRRILSLWFPRLAADRALRGERGVLPGPLAVVEEVANTQILASLSAEATAAGLRVGQPLRDARAMCPSLVTRSTNPLAEAAFLASLRRWAGKFSPWVAEEPPASLIIDLTGCAHLFGGEAALVAEAEADCADLGLSVRTGIADTPGAAWALARFGGAGGAQPAGGRSGDAIDQEARATRARAAKRRNWEKGGDAPQIASPAGVPGGRIAAPGKTRAALAHLPIAALRLTADTTAALARLGLTRIDDLIGLPRAALARRFGREVVWRLDQALGMQPEPVSPARPPHHFAVRLTFPDPIGLADDIAAAIDRLLPRLCERLAEKGRGARRVRLQAFRTDHGVQSFDLGLARPSAEPGRIRPLLLLKIAEIEPGFGIDMLRLEAQQSEPVHARTHKGHLDAAEAAMTRLKGSAGLDDLIGKLGARVGLEAITRLHPADSHIPEKTAIVLAAAWSEPGLDWIAPRSPRPTLLFRPEPVTACPTAPPGAIPARGPPAPSPPTPGPPTPSPPARFRWRRRDLALTSATGPERIAPEWWLDEPDWRSGLRDYWRIETSSGDRLWLFYAHGFRGGGLISGGWFCQGSFA